MSDHSGHGRFAQAVPRPLAGDGMLAVPLSELWTR